MGKPAARVGDMHVCPMVTPGVPPIPHVGGPIMPPGVPTVLIGGMPAATMGNMCTCTGPPDTIILGSMGVLIGGKPAARMGDSTVHGGKIVVGMPTVLIGESAGSGGGGGPAVVQFKTHAIKEAIATLEGEASASAQQIVTMQQAAQTGKPFCEKCEAARKEQGTKNK